MCGIAGKLNFDRNQRLEENLITRMCERLIHRGPDDQGVYEDYNFGFGARRLSIIDIKQGHQPIFNADNTLAIVFNGEIYNFKALRDDLFSKGYTFKTNSDTEVVLHAYEEYGKDCVHKLNGMFAFAIWDSKNQRLMLARDRIGIKPLYYYQDQTRLLFASELKAILEDKSVQRDVDIEALDLYLSFMYVPAPYSMFKNIKKLEPGHLLVHEEGQTQIESYWDVRFEVEDDTKSLTEYEEEFRWLLKDSIKSRMVSDVPLGAFLSGGIDSSSIVAYMSEHTDQPVKTFSIGFKGGGYHDETRFARMIADQYKTDHQEFFVDANIVDMLPDYIEHFDEPFADYAALPTYILSKLASEHVKVVLTGDGGDEIFAGYEKYESEFLAQQYKRVPSFVRNKMLLPVFNLGKRLSTGNWGMYKFFHGAQKKTRLMELADDERFIESGYSFNYDQKRSLFAQQSALKENFSLATYKGYLEGKDSYDFLSRRLYLDTKTMLAEDMLTKVDRVTMANSLEARVPFLDHRLVEFAARLPSRYKMKVFNLKKFVKDSVRDILPAKVINRPKHGFSSPINEWFRTDLRELVHDTLSENALSNQSLFNSSYITKMADDHMSAKNNYGKELFMLMVYQMWHDRYIR